MYTFPSSSAIAPFVNTTLLTSPVRSRPSGPSSIPDGSAMIFAGSCRSVAKAYSTYRSPAAVFRTPCAMWIQPLSVLIGTAPAPFLASVIVWYFRRDRIFSSPTTGCRISSHRPKPMPPPLPVSMKSSIGRV